MGVPLSVRSVSEAKVEGDLKIVKWPCLKSGLCEALDRVLFALHAHDKDCLLVDMQNIDGCWGYCTRCLFM